MYAELAPMLDRDAVVVIDAGDFGSYAGRVIDSYQPGCWLDSGRRQRWQGWRRRQRRFLMPLPASV
ncbi:hypothetical protein BHQ20_29190 [Mycobacterium intermedium]|nr:hypothetical protein BHQ20_29190 [Mycobacterium intermedium]